MRRTRVTDDYRLSQFGVSLPVHILCLGLNLEKSGSAQGYVVPHSSRAPDDINDAMETDASLVIDAYRYEISQHPTYR